MSRERIAMAQMMRGHSVRAWETRLVRGLLERRFAALIAVVALQGLLVLALGALLWSTKVKDTIVGFARLDPATGAISVSVPQADADKLRVGQPALLTVESRNNDDIGACTGDVVRIEQGASPGMIVAVIEWAHIAEAEEAGACAVAQRLLSADQEARVTLEVRTRRLLSLLLGG